MKALKFTAKDFRIDVHDFTEPASKQAARKAEAKLKKAANEGPMVYLYPDGTWSPDSNYYAKRGYLVFVEEE